MFRIRSIVIEMAETILFATFAFLIFNTIFQNYKVEGNSMTPNIRHGEHLLVNQLAYINLKFPLQHQIIISNNPSRGDIVIFKAPKNTNKNLIKRVIGLPGDTVEIIHGNVFINGTKLTETYIQRNLNLHTPKIRVSENNYFVLGDNRSASNDSRDWGTVPIKNISGKAWITYWPFTSFSIEKHG